MTPAGRPGYSMISACSSPRTQCGTLTGCRLTVSPAARSAGAMWSQAASAWALLGLRACSVGPAYKQPDIPPPAAWREAPPNDAQGVWPSADWWHGFGSQTLDDSVAEAQRSNDDLAAAVARVEEADAQARIAGAPLL